ncbi:MAG: Hsp20/alpha crystallin family protein [Thermodesulfobacteriota bacterium]
MTPFKGEAMKDLTSLQEKMNRIFSETVRRIKEMAEPDKERPWSPPVDIFELPDGFVLLAELPGVPREAVSVELQGQSLIIKGERPAVAQAADGNLYHAERHYGPFERTFNLPVTMASANIQARLEAGVLTVSVAKPDEETRRVKVNVE